jgi:transcriptional regulator with PAS, ATPase and Fis domain
MRSWPLSKSIECDPIPRRQQDYAGRVREVLETMARLSANGEHHRATVALNARLHAVRTIEIEVLPDAIEELTEIEQALEHDDRALLRRSLNTYHRHRIRAASKLVRAVYRTAPS